MQCTLIVSKWSVMGRKMPRRAISLRAAAMTKLVHVSFLGVSELPVDESPTCTHHCLTPALSLAWVVYQYLMAGKSKIRIKHLLRNLKWYTTVLPGKAPLLGVSQMSDICKLMPEARHLAVLHEIVSRIGHCACLTVKQGGVVNFLRSCNV